jgi:Tripartite tricarboxylate transporter family receptor
MMGVNNQKARQWEKEVGTVKCAVRVLVVTAIFILGMDYVSAAAEFPTRPITLINPVNPGGMNDILGRIWCAVARKYLGQPVVITNRPGGGGWQGLVDVKEAKPDGYTLLDSSDARVYLEQWALVFVPAGVIHGLQNPSNTKEAELVSSYGGVGSTDEAETVFVEPPWH